MSDSFGQRFRNTRDELWSSMMASSVYMGKREGCLTLANCTPDELLNSRNPLIHQVVSCWRRGDFTFEQALLLLVKHFEKENEGLKAELVNRLERDHLATLCRTDTIVQPAGAIRTGIDGPSQAAGVERIGEIGELIRVRTLGVGESMALVRICTPRHEPGAVVVDLEVVLSMAIVGNFLYKHADGRFESLPPHICPAGYRIPSYPQPKKKSPLSDLTMHLLPNGALATKLFDVVADKNYLIGDYLFDDAGKPVAKAVSVANYGEQLTISIFTEAEKKALALQMAYLCGQRDKPALLANHVDFPAVSSEAATESAQDFFNRVMGCPKQPEAK